MQKTHSCHGRIDSIVRTSEKHIIFFLLFHFFLLLQIKLGYTDLIRGCGKNKRLTNKTTKDKERPIAQKKTEKGERKLIGERKKEREQDKGGNQKSVVTGICTGVEWSEYRSELGASFSCVCWCC